MIEIRAAVFDDIIAVIDHDKRHMKEPGFNGSLSHPFLPDHEFNWESRQEEKLLSWTKPLTEEGWSRSFIILENGVVTGHIHLKNLFSGTLHRAQLGMGLEIKMRAQGYGKQLLQLAILWAKQQESLYWIDLQYFAHNLPAKKLYESAGFTQLFKYEDRIRVGQHVIDDVIMTLKLR